MGEGNAEVLKRDHTDLGDYDEDVTAEILARLPVKSLMRFRCFCKSWRALISDSYFLKKHLSYGERGITESAHRLICRLGPPFALDCEALESVKGDDVHGGSGGQFVTRLDFKTDCHFGYRNLVGACNGLVCVSHSGTVDSNDIMLWNPCTRDSKVLPKPPRVHYLSFYGFGYDSANDDYKVIRGFSYWDGAHSKFMVHIFSLQRGSWRTVKDIDYVQVLTQQGLYFNGALHWLYWVRQGCSRIFSLDLGAEKFQKTIPFVIR
ncbi:hypothetical protein ACLB2K_062789 [Fragaria x ananassa]